MDNDYNYLFQREKCELELCEKNLELFNKYICDYNSLKSRLMDFSDQTSYNVMVPVAGTKLAFFPGYIHHTNELMMLIGENYFVEKSNKQALEFVDRRIKFCKSKLEMITNQKTMLENWIRTTENLKNDSEQLVDITETCTDEELKQWEKEHFEKLQLAKNAKEANQNIDMDEFFDKYEKQEKSENEIDSNEIENIQPFKLNIVEKSELVLPDKNIPAPSTRPVSKFKSRNRK